MCDSEYVAYKTHSNSQFGLLEAVLVSCDQDASRSEVTILSNKDSKQAILCRENANIDQTWRMLLPKTITKLDDTASLHTQLLYFC